MRKSVLAALERNKKFLRGEIAHRVNLKFAPDIRFRIDERFDEAERIEKILRTPRSPPRSRAKTATRIDERRTSSGSTQDFRALHAARQAGQHKREKRDVHGWIVLDKPVGMTSTHAVAVIKRLFTAKRAGHAGTLDPLASGLLPIALGEATKTVPFVMDGRKRYRFTVRWGEERDTDDAEGRVVATSDARPTRRAIRACLPALHRHDRAGAAAILRHQDRGRARL